MAMAGEASIATCMGGSKMAMFCKQTEDNVVSLYLGFLAAVCLVMQSHDGVGLSTFLTLSVALQFFALVCLHTKVGQGNVAGVSKKSLIMQTLVYACRLSSTTWLKGYIPTDTTGDYLYQIMDMLTLLVALRIVYCCAKTHKHTYQEEFDSMPIGPLVIGCFLLAILVHPDLNDRPLFDTLWATSLYIDVVAMAPQLWMMSKCGKAEGVTSHYVASIAGSRAVNLIFWYYGYEELAPEDGGVNVAGYAIIAAHVLQIMLMGDFIVLYIKAGCTKACGTAAPCGSTAQTQEFVEI